MKKVIWMIAPGIKTCFMKIILTIVLSFYMHIAGAQFVFTKFPMENSMVARNLQSNKGGILFYFTSPDTLQAVNVLIKKFTGPTLTTIQNPSFTINGSQIIYTWQDSIPAALQYFRYELWYNNTLVRQAGNICCGDFYILNGQSNAESGPTQDLCYPYYSNFIRTYGNANEAGSKKEWFVGSGDGNRNTDGHVGQLGIALANELISKQSIPIGIFNGAVGGMPLQYFLPNALNHDDTLTSYGRLLTRVKDAGAQDEIRAFVWYQGEKDAGNCVPMNSYINLYQTLYLAWKADYPGFEDLYLFQIRPGCAQNRYCTTPIQQAHQLITTLDNHIEVLSTANVGHANDQCHYGFQYGYKILGKKAARLICANQYNSMDTVGIHSPKVVKCYTRYLNYADIVPDQPLLVDLPAAGDFYLTQSQVEPLSIQVINDTIRLLFANAILPGETISYSGHAGLSHPYLENQQGNGLLYFYNTPIEPYCEIPVTSLTQTACNAFTLNGQTYTSSGIYTQVYPGTYGCDSIITLDLTVHYSTGIAISQTVCDSFSLNGQTYFNTGVYYQQYLNANACDSIVTLNLVVNTPTASWLNQAACDTYTLNGETFTHSGLYTQHFINANGCDSTVNLNLALNHTTTAYITDTSCGPYILNGQTYINSGIYVQYLTNVAGCDSILTINLTVKPAANTTVAQTGPLLHANAVAASYQWLYCTPYQVIPGGNNQDLTATQNGDYAVIVTQGGCSDTSNCITVTGLTIPEHIKIDLLMYPNPVKQVLILKSSRVFQDAGVKVINYTGQTVLARTQITGNTFELNLNGLAKGNYLVVVTDYGETYTTKVFKE